MLTKNSVCRICAGQCALKVAFGEDGEIHEIRGDKDDPLTRGYACIKGLTLHEAHKSERRLLHPLRRRPDGAFEQVSLSTALDDIAARIEALIARHGPDAVGAFKGTMNYTNFLANLMFPAFHRAIGSSAFYSTMTIDQSAKWVTADRLGVWAAGKDAFDLADVLMIVGSNPLVSLSTFNFALQNPMKRLREARARGMRLIVIDPRRTETAANADLVLQPLPGEDVTVLATLIRIILDQSWHDEAFCARYVEGLDALRDAVAPFTPEASAVRAGVSVESLFAAAALFAQPVASDTGFRRPRGSAASGTGPNMARHSNLAEHLVETLNVICGRFARPGDPVPNPGVIGARTPRYAQVVGPRRTWQSDEHRSPSGYGRLFGERMSGALADDILTEAPDRLRAMIVVGGNPVVAMPETTRAAKAFAALELLVTIDPFMTRTAQLSHYVLPPRMMFERHEIGNRDYAAITTFAPYANYSAPILSPPEGAEVEEDWVFLWEIAKRLGRPIELDGAPIRMDVRPSSEQLIAHLLARSGVPFDTLKKEPAGKIFDVPPMQVLPGDESSGDRFAVAPTDVVAELSDVAAESNDGAFPFRLACRRMRDVQNTMYHHLPSIRRRAPHNTAYLHPDDLAVLGVLDGALVTLRTAHGAIEAVARADPHLRRSVVSLPHGWDQSTTFDDQSYAANVNELTSSTIERDPINAMPVMSGFPVSVEIRRAE